ncbi:MAG: hypothetical protein GXY33_04280 [Phycisphaerae bacterium]|nr:hypothetical protein [Phycisphaerae bacterium]
MNNASWVLLAIGVLCGLGPPACSANAPEGSTAVDATNPSLTSSGPFETIKAVRLVLLPDRNEPAENVAAVFTRQLGRRCPAVAVTSGEAPITVELAIEPGIGRQGFRISDRGLRTIRIAGNDRLGLLYGVGKFLRTCGYREDGLVLSPWRGASVPQKTVRGIYFATHFHNYYHEAPIEEVRQYVEDLSLWGVNVLLVWFDMHHFDSIDDPKAQAMLTRLRALFQTAKDLGLATAMGTPVNEAYATSPADLRADSGTVNHNGYYADHGPRIYNLGPELCPNKPGAMDLLLKWNEEKLRVFQETGLDYYMLWPYDSGGCTCEQCKVWGANGFLKAGEPIARLYRRFFPDGKVILSTWYFDRWGIGEWEGITAEFNRQRPDWIDYILADNYGGKFPPYPLAHGSPGGLPMINFPEISMYLHEPWGGYGANPAPAYLQSLWDVTKDKLSGGFPYSEGIYEDINKAICAQLYWDPDRPAHETVREYIAFNFSPAAVDPVSRAIAILEKNIERRRHDADGVTRIVMTSIAGADEAWRLIAETDAQLPDPVRQSWRWRVLYLRALIDAELARCEFRVSDRCEAAFRELERIYHAQHALDMVRPPAHIRK